MLIIGPNASQARPVDDGRNLRGQGTIIDQRPGQLTTLRT
jgi:hypothetical protein